uniref:Zinc transporter ZIP8 n=1 Tax=Syphacia muris TaxID=451379 RepID=A0A0N5ABD2_9BILA
MSAVQFYNDFNSTLTLSSSLLNSGNETLELSTALPSLRSRPSNFALWLLGLTCVTVISLCAAVGIIFVRGLSSRAYHFFITVFVGVGVGSLITSSTLHLLPQGLGLVDDVHYDFIVVQLFCIFGIYTFFFCDKFIKITLESKKVKNDTEALNLSLAKTNVEAGGFSIRSTDGLLAEGQLKRGEFGSADVSHRRESYDIARVQSIIDDDMNVSRQEHGICVHDHDLSFNDKKDSAIKTVAWMIVFGDGLHNFIDGISIGAAFSESLLSGFSVSLAVLAEEFPHELGDVAILLNSGMNLTQTLVYNLLSTITCFIGFAVGVLLGSVESFLRYIFGFSGGMFLYIALSCMMPEMKQTMEEALTISRQDALVVLALQSSGLAIGTLSMFFFARYGYLLSLF